MSVCVSRCGWCSCIRCSSVDGLGSALQETSTSGLFADLASFLLTTIFQLEEEEEEYDDDTLDDKEEIKGWNDCTQSKSAVILFRIYSRLAYY